MKLYLKRMHSDADAIAEYDEKAKTITVLKGSILTKEITKSEKFRSAKAIARYRDGIVEGNRLVEDITFNSASTAANFVTGNSANGLTEWKDANGKTLKRYLSEKESNNY